MRKCPQCGQTYGDDSDFCTADGATLAADQSQHRVVVSLDDPPRPEVPTQYVRTVPPPQPAPQNSGILYAVIGALVAVIVIGGGYVLLRPNGEIASNPPANTQNSVALSPTPDLNANGLFTGGVSNSTPVPSNVNAVDSAMQNAYNTAVAAANAAANAAMTAVNSAARPSRRFSRTYTGTVDDDAIEMFLEKNGSSLTGRVAPRGRSADIYVSGYVRDDGTFEMEEKSDIGVVTGVYRGRLNGNSTISGTWSKPDGAKTRSMFLRSQ